jgi:hypothetical protein
MRRVEARKAASWILDDERPARGRINDEGYIVTPILRNKTAPARGNDLLAGAQIEFGLPGRGVIEQVRFAF